DIAETVLLNILRGDIARLSRCTFITTGEDGPIPRRKPFKYTYEKEIVIYPCYAIDHFFFMIYYAYNLSNMFDFLDYITLCLLFSHEVKFNTSANIQKSSQASIHQMHIADLLVNLTKI
ncbi:hypothetical protein EJB05_22643, partial [Eragrostis curvula]